MKTVDYSLFGSRARATTRAHISYCTLFPFLAHSVLLESRFEKIKVDGPSRVQGNHYIFHIFGIPILGIFNKEISAICIIDFREPPYNLHNFFLITSIGCIAAGVTLILAILLIYFWLSVQRAYVELGNNEYMYR